MKKTKEQKGITLISLVITIILLLILATVAISLAVDSDGLFSKAGEAANKWNSSVATEQTEMQDLLNKLGIKEPIELPEGWNSNKIADIVKEGDRIAPIPAGFVASKVSTEDEISEGLVIYQTNTEVNDTNYDTALTTYNQYVWIPVDDINDMVMCSICGGGVKKLVYNDETKILACTSAHADGITPTLVGKLYTATEGYTEMTDASGNPTGVIWEYDMNFEQDTQEYPEDYTGYREPAVVDGDNDNGVTLSQLQSDFDSMAVSVAKYKGFYIGRYEIGEAGTSKKGQIPMMDMMSTMWYGFYYKLNKEETSTTSQMIWGSQYDQVIKFIGEEAEIGHADRNISSEPAFTGNNPEDEMKNIFDLEGNCGEFTVEAADNQCRVFRGGHFTYTHDAVGYNYYPASMRHDMVPTTVDHAYSSRIALYVNL